MLHKFSFKDDKVSYANKFLESEAFKSARETNKISYREFATDPCRTTYHLGFTEIILSKDVFYNR